LFAFPTQPAQRRGVERQDSTCLRRQAAPTSTENAEKVTMRKDRHVAVDRTQPDDDAIRTYGDIRR
jgi:hypothetical protein